MPKERLFLERRSYRRRRMMDAVRLLPLVGLCLWFVPMMWPLAQDDGTSGIATSTALCYIFGIWVLLGAFACALWLRTRNFAEVDERPQDPAAPVASDKDTL